MIKFRFSFLILIAIFSFHLLGSFGCNSSTNSQNGDSDSDQSTTTSPEIIQGRNSQEFIIPASFHPLGKEITAVVLSPSDAELLTPHNAAIIVHGSGGLFKENGLGNECSQELESKYLKLANELVAKGLTVVLPSSMYSRKFPKFCEDNSDYIDFGPSDWDREKRRLAYRTYDLYAAANYTLSLPQIEEIVLFTGTSNGASIISHYIHKYFDYTFKKFFDEDNEDLSPITYVALPNRPLPKVVIGISAGCGFHGAIDLSTDPDDDIKDLFFPADQTSLYLEIGDDDDVPDECTTQVPGYDGRREIQVNLVLDRLGISKEDSPFHITIYENGEHDLLGGPYGQIITEKILGLIN